MHWDQKDRKGVVKHPPRNRFGQGEGAYNGPAVVTAVRPQLPTHIVSTSGSRAEW